MHGPGSSKKMESAGLIGKLPFLNVHTTFFFVSNGGSMREFNFFEEHKI